MNAEQSELRKRFIQVRNLMTPVESALNLRDSRRLSDVELYTMCHNLQTYVASAYQILIYPEVYAGARCENKIILQPHEISIAPHQYPNSPNYIARDWSHVIHVLNNQADASILLNHSGMCLPAYKSDLPMPHIHWREILCR